MTQLAFLGPESEFEFWASLARRLDNVVLAKAGIEQADGFIVRSDLATREEQCLRAMEMANYLLVSAPLAESLPVAQQIVAECENAHTGLMLSRPFRLLPAVSEVSANVRSGKLGQLGLVRIHRWSPSSQGSDAPSDIILNQLIHEIDDSRQLVDGLAELVVA